MIVGEILLNGRDEMTRMIARSDGSVRFFKSKHSIFHYHTSTIISLLLNAFILFVFTILLDAIRELVRACMHISRIRDAVRK